MNRINLIYVLFAIIILFNSASAAPTTTSDANAIWNLRSSVTFTCNDSGGSGCRDLNYSLNSGVWVDVNFGKSVGTFNLKGSRNDGNQGDGDWAIDVWGDGAYVYLANNTGGIWAYDFNGTTFNLKGTRNDRDIANGVWGDGTYVYFANDTGGIWAYDFNGTTFNLKGTRNDGDWAIDVWGDGTYVYLANGTSGIWAYDFSGTTFNLKGTRDDGDIANGVWGDGTYVYFANDTGGIWAYDFNGTTFNLKGSRNDGDSAYGVWGDGTYVYLANGGSGIRAYDFNGTTFNLKGSRNDGDWAIDVWGDGAYVYLANSTGGIWAYDFNGTTFNLKGTRNDGDWANGVWGDGTYVYLANGTSGIWAYDFNGILTYTITVPDGNNKIEFKSTDNANNTESIQTAYHALDTSAPTTTFSSFQIPNTTDQNLTLTCVDDGSCKTIHYDIDGTGYVDVDENYVLVSAPNQTNSDAATYAVSSGESLQATYTFAKIADRNTYVKSITNQIQASSNQGYCYYKIFFNGGTSETTSTESIANAPYETRIYTFTNNNRDVNYIELWLKNLSNTVASKNSVITYDLNTYYNPVNPLSFLVHGTGAHLIDFYSTDNADNDEAINSESFSTTGFIRFNVYDENTGLALDGVTINDGTNDYDTGATNYYDFNLDGTPMAGNQTYTLSKTGYTTRYYALDQNEYTDKNILFALLLTGLNRNIQFQFYQPGEVILYSNVYVQVEDTFTNYVLGRVKTSGTGLVTFGLDQNSAGTQFDMNNSENTYNPVLLTIKYPKNIATLVQLTELWTLTSAGGVTLSLTNLSTDYNIYILPGILTTFHIGDVNGNYTQSTYTRTYYADSTTGYDILQSYLFAIFTSLATTINVQNTNTKTPIPNVTIKFYGNLPGLGSTLIGQGTTDSKGQILQLFIGGQAYVFDMYYGGVLLQSYNYTAQKTETWIYYSFLNMGINHLTPIDVNGTTAFKHLNAITTTFYTTRNALFSTCSARDPCFPSALVSIILTIIVLLTSTTIAQPSFIGVKGLSIVAFCCFTIFFGIGWLPIFIYAFLGSITLLMAVMV